MHFPPRVTGRTRGHLVPLRARVTLDYFAMQIAGAVWGFENHWFCPKAAAGRQEGSCIWQ